MIPAGWYRDAFEPSGPVEVLGEAVDIDTGARRVVIRIPGSPLMELVRPFDFTQTVTVKDGNGTAQITRFIPTSERG